MSNYVQSLKQIFGRFSGQALQDPYTGTNQVDPIVEAIRDEAELHGLEVWVEYPGAQLIPDSRQDRLRVEVRDDYGTYRVDGFRIG